MRYELVLNPPGEPVNEEDPEDKYSVEFEENPEANELEPLVPNEPAEPARTSSPSLAHKILGGLFSHTTHTSYSSHLAVSPVVTLTPATPASSDGVFSNIPAKPTTSRQPLVGEEELGEDEWIFMTTEQRKKLSPPKYSKIKRDRAPRYSTEYTPPAIPVGAGTLKSCRSSTVRPRVNSLPAGPSGLFVVTAVICTLLPFIGYPIIYLASRGRWKSHAARLGSQMGMGLGLLHVGAMMFYIPALLPGVLAASFVPLLLFLVWTAFVGLPFGWRLSLRAVREYSWLKAEERVLLERVVRANLVVAAEDGQEEQEDEDGENGDRYIEGTDIRVRDLRKIIARARDARLARSLRAAGF